MGSGVGIKGSTEVVGRMTGKTVDWVTESAIKHRNIATYLAAIHFQL
jgi:hypothetical protein